GEEVEGHARAEHGRGLDDATLVVVEIVELTAHELTDAPRQRLLGELLRVLAAGAGEELLEEVRVAAGAGVQRLDHAVRRGVPVHGGEERGHVGGAQPVEVQVRHRPAAFEARYQLPGRLPARQRVGPVGRQEEHGPARRLCQPLEDGDARRIGPVQVVEHDDRGPRPRQRGDGVLHGRDPFVHRPRVVEHGGARVVAEDIVGGIEHERERAAERARVRLPGEHLRAAHAAEQFAHEAGLADARLATDEGHRGRVGAGRQLHEAVELTAATDHHRTQSWPPHQHVVQRTGTAGGISRRRRRGATTAGSGAAGGGRRRTSARHGALPPVRGSGTSAGSRCEHAPLKGSPTSGGLRISRAFGDLGVERPSYGTDGLEVGDLRVEDVGHLDVGHVEAVLVRPAEHVGDALVVLDHDRVALGGLVAAHGHAPHAQVLEVPSQQRAHVVEAQAGGDLVGEAVRDERDRLLEIEVRLLRLRAERDRLASHRDERDADDEEGADDEEEDAQMPMRCASSSRWYVGSPNSSADDFARLKYRWAGCSHVNPMPPWIWMFSAAAWKYASLQYAFASDATDGSSSLSSDAHQPAEYAADLADSTSSSMSAHLCLMAWNEPMGRPNWMRTLAYSTLMSRQRCAPPTCSAARATAARSSVLDRAAWPPPSVPISRAGVLENSRRACLRVMSIVERALRVSPDASPSTAKKLIPAAVRATTTMRLAVCPSMTNILWPS